MTYKKPLLIVFAAGLAAFFLSFFILTGNDSLSLKIIMECQQPDHGQVFWDSGAGWNEKENAAFKIKPGKHLYKIDIPKNSQAIRIDPAQNPGLIVIEEIRIEDVASSFQWNANRFSDWSSFLHDLEFAEIREDGVQLRILGYDPFFINSDWKLATNHLLVKNLLFSAGAAVLLVLSMGTIFVVRSKNKLYRDWLINGALLTFSTGVCLSLAFMIFQQIKPKEYVVPPAGYGVSFFASDGRRISEVRGSIKLQFDPFMIYVNAPSQKTSILSIDEHGFRGGYGSDEKVKAFVLGGSAAFGHSLSSDETAFASILNTYGEKYEFINAAVIGYQSGQELALMVHKLDNFRPALYIVFDGWNDLFDPLLAPRAKGEFGFINVFFMLQDRLAIHHLEQAKKKNLIFASAKRKKARDIDTENPAYLEEISQAYTNNLSKMNRFANGAGASFLVVFQPELGAKHNLNEKEKQVLNMWEQTFGYLSMDFSRKYKQMINRAKLFCDKNNIEYIDMNSSPQFVNNKNMLFYDNVHINELGHKIAAEMIHDRLVHESGSFHTPP